MPENKKSWTRIKVLLGLVVLAVVVGVFGKRLGHATGDAGAAGGCGGLPSSANTPNASAKAVSQGTANQAVAVAASKRAARLRTHAPLRRELVFLHRFGRFSGTHTLPGVTVPTRKPITLPLPKRNP